MNYFVHSLKKEGSYICGVEKKQIEIAFNQLGLIMSHFGNSNAWSGFDIGITEEEHKQFNEVIVRQKHYNGWFTEEMVRKSLLSLGNLLTQKNLEDWTSGYTFSSKPSTIALIMAGNIPLVGFHDFLSVLFSGNKVLAKLSSDDKHLLPALASFLYGIEPELSDRIKFSEGKISDFDAVIATGSDSSALYFEQYFSSYPHIFRSNRTSLAILDGSEDIKDIELLAQDIFDYYGRGCRNVSHLVLPRGFNINRIFEGIVTMGDVIYNKKYGNNYDYNKAVHLLNLENLLDNNFVLLKESDELHSPLGMLNYHFYDSELDVKDYLNKHKNKLQCIVGKDYVPYGSAQKPALNEYADGLDTLKWLNELK